jgi:3-oxoacyl-[acyl-carrier-protein] synthase-3
VLVAGSERYSDILDWDDRSTCIIFADGAGAALVGPAQSAADAGVGPVVWGSDGTRGELIAVDERQLVRMSGPAVYRWATTELAPIARAACERAGVDVSDLRAFVPHQANLRIIDLLVKTLRLEHAAVARDVVDTGNTSAASIPMALCRLVESGAVHRGDPALLIGFGSGLTYAAQVVLCP